MIVSGYCSKDGRAGGTLHALQVPAPVRMKLKKWVPWTALYICGCIFSVV